MKEHILIFITHFDDFLDLCLGLNNERDEFQVVLQMYAELREKSRSMTAAEYNKVYSELFYEYLKVVGVVE